MTLQVFKDKITTVATSWLNSVDVMLDTVFGTPTTKAQARAALTSDAPMSVGQGGTNATTAAGALASLGAADATLVAHNTGNETLAGIKTFSSNPIVAGGAVQFPAAQVPSADPNALDDYEEGVWTPSLGGTATYTTQIGKYTKIGNLVFIECFLVVNAIGTGSTSVVQGLPFTAGGASDRFTFSASNFSSLAINVYSVWGYVQHGASQIVIEAMTALAAAPTSPATVFGNGTAIFLTGCYQV